MLGPFATTSRLTQAPLAVLRSSLGIAHVQLSCVTNVGLVCVVERCDLTELKEVLLLLYYIWWLWGDYVYFAMLCIIYFDKLNKPN